MANKKIIHYKFVLLGDSNTGKTSICLRYVSKKFEQIFQSTIGCSFLGKVLEIDNKNYNLDIWDTAGQERYRALLPMYYRNADVALICIEIDKSDFSEEINYWINELDKYCDKINRITIIVGTKMDLINEEEQETFKNKMNTHYPKYRCFITSSKNNTGINELFNFGMNKCIENESINNILANNKLDNLSLDENNSYWELLDMCNIL